MLGLNVPICRVRVVYGHKPCLHFTGDGVVHRRLAARRGTLLGNARVRLVVAVGRCWRALQKGPVWRRLGG